VILAKIDMLKHTLKNRILILGASGFIGRSIYLELRSYFDVYGTYATNNVEFAENNVYFKYCLEEDILDTILQKIKPVLIISALRGDYKLQLAAHRQLCHYINENHSARIIYLSSMNVFDGRFKFPSYENDKPLAKSDYGKFKISGERMLLKNIPAQAVILRLPIVLGIHSPRILQLRQAIKHKAAFDVYPNLTISITTADKVAQQIHYIISKELDGIFHLSSYDMVHHEDLFREITSRMGDKTPIFKSVYRRNDDEYLAILPKKNKLPENYQISVAEAIEDSTLNKEIATFKH
jgi:dTDP-4-dehydrorhamnose reductase